MRLSPNRPIDGSHPISLLWLNSFFIVVVCRISGPHQNTKLFANYPGPLHEEVPQCDLLNYFYSWSGLKAGITGD